MATVDGANCFAQTSGNLVDDGVYYLYNQYDDNNTGDKNRFLARGKNYGTHAVVDKYGIPVRIINQGDDIVKLQFADGSNGYMKETWFLYTDGTENGDNTNTFKILPSTVDGVEGYHFATQQVSQNLDDKQYMYVWLIDNDNYYKVAGNANSPHNVAGNNVANDFTRTVWKLLTPAERNAIINSYSADNAKDLASGATETYQKPASLPDDQTIYWLIANYTPENVASNEAWEFTKVYGNKGDGTDDAAGTTELYQSTGTFTKTIENLDPGIYKVSLQAFERHGSSENAKTMGSTYGNIGAAYMIANGQQVHIAAWHEAYTGTNDPNSMAEAAAKFNDGKYVNEVFAYVGSDHKLTISVTEPGRLGSSWFIMKDAITLTYYNPDNKKTVAQPIGTYYLRNKATGKYVTFDGYWGTYYSMSDAGKQLTLKTSDDGATLIHTTYLSNTDDVTSSHDTENYFYSYPGNIEHAFSNGNSREGGEKWVFYSDGKGGYSIMNFMTGYYLSGSQDYDSSHRGWGGLMKPTDTDDYAKWELVTKEELTTALTANGATYPLDASFLIDEPDLITGYNNVYQEFYSWKVMGNDQTKYSDWNTNNITTFYYDNTKGTSEGNCSYAYCAASDYPDILQTITGIPNGLYVVECQAVFRDGNSGAAGSDQNSSSGKYSSRLNADRLADGTYVNRAYLYANDNLGTEPDDARDKRDRYWIYENAQMMPVNVATDAYFGVSSSLLTAFRDRQHTVQIPIYVTTGNLTIGVLQEIGINNNLLVFDRFRLKYYGTNYSGDEVKNIAKGNLERLSKYYEDTDNHTAYQKYTITNKEIAKVTTAIRDINSDWSNTSSTTIYKYNKVAQDYGETSINWYIFKVLQDDYKRGDYTTVEKDGNRESSEARYPFVDEASKKEVVKYFGAGTDTNNAINYYDNYGDATYSAEKLIENLQDEDATLENLKAAINAIRTYVEANAEARYIEDEEVKAGATLTDEQRKTAREARMALVTGSAEAITTEDGKYPAYDTNPLMFSNAGVTITAPELDQVVHEARCWAPRDAYGYRFYDYKNYYGAGPHNYEIKIDGLVTGKYLVTISESHNNELHSVLFNAYVGNTQIVEDKQLFREDGSVWQSYTHSWQDVSCVVDIDADKQFQTVRLTFTGGGEGAAWNATMNICNLRIYRMEGIEMLLLDENETRLAKHKNYTNIKTLLKREMATNQWNTLTLPVNLTKQQVMAGFGEGTILATMDGFSKDYGEPDNCIHFTTNDLKLLGDNDTAIEEGKVYLIKPTAEPAVVKGETATYKNADEGQSTYTEIPGPVYYLDYVNYSLTTKDGQTEPNISHTPPTGGDIYPATGAQAGKLSLQMQGTYSQKVVPVNETDQNGGTNYIYAFQQQSDGNVYLVELDPSNSKSYEGFEGTGRLFKGYRGWAVANYTESAPVRQSYLVLLDEGDDQLTVIRGIDSEEGYSEVKIPRQGVYDLQGRSIDRKEFYSGSYPQGVYIVDGKKVVRK